MGHEITGQQRNVNDVKKTMIGRKDDFGPDRMIFMPNIYCKSTPVPLVCQPPFLVRSGKFLHILVGMLFFLLKFNILQQEKLTDQKSSQPFSYQLDSSVQYWSYGGLNDLLPLRHDPN